MHFTLPLQPTTVTPCPLLRSYRCLCLACASPSLPHVNPITGGGGADSAELQLFQVLWEYCIVARTMHFTQTLQPADKGHPVPSYVYIRCLASSCACLSLFLMLSLCRIMLHVARNCKAPPSCNLNYFVGHLPGNAY